MTNKTINKMTDKTIKSEIENSLKRISLLNSLLTTTLIKKKRGEDVFLEDVFLENALTELADRLDEELLYTKQLTSKIQRD